MHPAGNRTHLQLQEWSQPRPQRRSRASPRSIPRRFRLFSRWLHPSQDLHLFLHNLISLVWTSTLGRHFECHLLCPGHYPSHCLRKHRTPYLHQTQLGLERCILSNWSPRGTWSQPFHSWMDCHDSVFFENGRPDLRNQEEWKYAVCKSR